MQKMMLHHILESIYEAPFLDCSYGFRRGRECHDAIRALHQHLFRYEVETVIDVDLAGYFVAQEALVPHSSWPSILRQGPRRQVHTVTYECSTARI